MKNCPFCGKEYNKKSATKIGNKVLISLKCGHSLVTENDDFHGFSEFKGEINGNYLYNFQIESCKFAVKGKNRVLLNLDVGLGKTAVSTTVIKKQNLFPCLILTKAGLGIQTFKEIYFWHNEISQIIKSPKDDLLPVNFFIMSLDIARKFTDDDIANLPFKSIIIDECQHIKSISSQRTIAVMKMCERVETVIALSATPIKNRAIEYFPILNILRSNIFPSYNAFERNWVDGYGGIYDPKLFKEVTKDFIIRFKKDDVLPDLPKLRRDFRYYDLEKEVKVAYDKLVAEFIESYEKEDNKKSFAAMSNLLAYLQKMRHLTGFAKIKPAVEFLEDFLLSEGNEKITVFCDHILVAQQIHKLINVILKEGGFAPAVYYSSDLNSIQRNNVVEEFRKPQTRIMIASTKAAGEGLNLQFCNNCLFVERQWNPSNEEQAEGRFSRPGSLAEHIQATYLIALGTIDEFLTEIIEKKRNILKGALEGVEVKYNESEILTELADKLIASKKKRWSF